MKTINELKNTNRLYVSKEAADGGQAIAYLSSNKKNIPAAIVFSNGGGWDHVSASYYNRVPTWEEMCEIKNMFFHPEEVCVQYHPSESEYVNTFKYCLHIWRKQDDSIPAPPSWMIGAKKGQTIQDAFAEGKKALGG